jgi:hypothetical protein
MGVYREGELVRAIPDAGDGDGFAAQDVRAVEARICRSLGALAEPTVAGGRVLPPPAYIRRHLADHAAAGDSFSEVVSTSFLPFVDALRLKAGLVGVRGAARISPSAGALMESWLQAAYVWDWDAPEANATALALWAASGCESVGPALTSLTPASVLPGSWKIAWARWRLGTGQTIGRHTARVAAVACTQLPGGRSIAVTGSWDNTVWVWDLTTGAPIGGACQFCFYRPR